PSLTKGEQEWDYLYSEDAADALYLLGECNYGSEYTDADKDGRIYCLGSGQSYPLKEYIKVMRDVIDKDLELGFGEVPYSDKQVMHLCADISELTKDTGFSPQMPFPKGIVLTVKYVKEACRFE
ncbi:MAG: hypothetical protein K6E53_15165, partial [Lachnospiraceae bacterium]|nr:hypothetical protein [Lachnospiraceae bacterium]